ncbi:MAG: hypothetical protein IJ071_11970 [Ruminococcus sp.]|nr:hypothetical protein [Ruminococcus sp.]
MAVWIGFLVISIICAIAEKLLKRHRKENSPPPRKLSEEKLYSAADLYLLKTGDTPPKETVQRNFSVISKEIYFDLSGDFIEFNSHCELDPAYQYEPDSDSDFTGFKEDYPQIWFGPTEEIRSAVEEYFKNGTAGIDFVELRNDHFLFAATVDYYGDRLRFYAFNENTHGGLYSGIGLVYSRNYEGTSLERKLIAALDEAAATYDEVE